MSQSTLSSAKRVSGRSPASAEVRLALEDGTEWVGRAFGAVRAVAGEVVFNTGMTGYIETLTDPSYRGQILVCTYPLQGNYGVPGPRSSKSIDPPFESTAIQVQGLVVQSYVADYSHHAAGRSLGEWLASESVPAATGIDTRTLTRRLREEGTMAGWMFPAAMSLEQAKRDADRVEMTRDVFRIVAPDKPVDYGSEGPRILLVDAGAKDNMVRSLLERGARVRRVPWHIDLAKEATKADGIVIGNGPGDPSDLDALIEQVRGLLSSYNKPLFGICLGNQILALAAGGRTYKLPYGHRGVNQPVQDLMTRRSYITSQNHGYAVDASSLTGDWEPWFVNINDGTNEGVRSRRHPHFGVQFHPEARPGPQDTGFLFDEFLRRVAVV